MRRLPLLAILLATTSAPAAPLGESLYPGLVEFDEAYELYTAGDFARARTGFRHLAELGDPEAQLNLGVMLAKGEGGPADRIEGAAWVRAAEDGGMADAAGVRAVLERGLDETQLDAITARMAALRPAARESASGPEEPADQEASSECPIRMVYRAEPIYPRNTERKLETGFVQMELLVDPTGVVGAAHASHRQGDDAFERAAVRAVNRWRAEPCPNAGHRGALQTIQFGFEWEGDGRDRYSSGTRQFATRLLAAAREGDAGAAFEVVLLADHHPDLFELGPDEDEVLTLVAAIGGRPDARLMLGSSDDRWIILAARQGYAPALHRVANWRRLGMEERKRALIEAARAGYAPAAFNVVRWLAAHPQASQRDGALALELIEPMNRAQRDRDLLLMQAHAMALAETGDTRGAARLQDRVMKALRTTPQNQALASARLAAYVAGNPWRDTGLARELGLAGDE